MPHAVLSHRAFEWLKAATCHPIQTALPLERAVFVKWKSERVERVPCRTCPWLLSPSATMCPHCGDVRRPPLLSGMSSLLLSAASLYVASLALAVKIGPPNPVDPRVVGALMGGVFAASAALAAFAAWFHRRLTDRRLDGWNAQEKERRSAARTKPHGVAASAPDQTLPPRSY